MIYNKNETIITNQILINILDEEGYQIDSYPIGNSPIKNILCNNIKLVDIFTISGVEIISGKDDVYKITTVKKDSDNSNGEVLFFLVLKNDLI